MNIFEKIIRREIHSKIVFEDEHCLAFHDVSPKAPVHVLLIPKRALRSLAEIATADEKLLGHLMLKVSEVARTLGLEGQGYRVVANVGENAGQSVPHLHFHILGGRPMAWPPG